MNTPHKLSIVSSLTLGLIAVAAVGCSAPVVEDDAQSGDDALTQTAGRGPRPAENRVASLCSADEKIVFSCTRSANGQAVDGYLISICEKDGAIQFRRGNPDDTFSLNGPLVELPKEPGPAASIAAIGVASTDRGSKGTYLRLRGDEDVVAYSFARTAPSTTGEEVGETWAGAAFMSNGHLSGVLLCADTPTVDFGKAGAKPGAELDASVIPHDDSW